MSISRLILAGGEVAQTNAGNGITRNARFTSNQAFCRSFCSNASLLDDTTVEPLAVANCVMEFTTHKVFSEGIGKNYTKDGKTGTIATNKLKIRAEVTAKGPNGTPAEGSIFIGTAAAAAKGPIVCTVSVGRVPNDTTRLWVAFAAVEPVTDENELAKFAAKFETIEATAKEAKEAKAKPATVVAP